METSNKKICHTSMDTKEAKIKMFVVVEAFRFVAWLWFLFLFVVGVILTDSFAVVDYNKVLREVFGITNTCAYFDWYPSTYVLPVLYALLPTLMLLYCLASIFRAWIAKNENKINNGSFVCYTLALSYFFISLLLFAIIFAIQPNPKEPVTIQIHTLPFTNLTFAMMLAQAAIAWLNYKVAWAGTDFFRWMSTINFINLFIIIVTSIIQILIQLNAVLFIETTLQIENGEVVNNGWIWFVQDHNALNAFFTFVDITWTISVIGIPILQGGYLLYRGHDTDGLIITIEDNRKSKADIVPNEA